MRGASFTAKQLVVAANTVGTTVFGVSVTSGNESALRGVLLGFPR